MTYINITILNILKQNNAPKDYATICWASASRLVEKARLQN